MIWFVHHEEAIHPEIRCEVKWSIDMPDDEPNPRMEQRSSIPVGMGRCLWTRDLTLSCSKDRALCYTAAGFTLFSWKEISGPEDDGRCCAWS